MCQQRSLTSSERDRFQCHYLSLSTEDLCPPEAYKSVRKVDFYKASQIEIQKYWDIDMNEGGILTGSDQKKIVSRRSILHGRIVSTGFEMDSCV